MWKIYESCACSFLVVNVTLVRGIKRILLTFICKCLVFRSVGEWQHVLWEKRYLLDCCLQGTVNIPPGYCSCKVMIGMDIEIINGDWLDTDLDSWTTTDTVPYLKLLLQNELPENQELPQNEKLDTHRKSWIKLLVSAHKQGNIYHQQQKWTAFRYPSSPWQNTQKCQCYWHFMSFRCNV